MRAFVSRLHGLSGKPVVLKNHLVCLSLSIISRMVFGKKHFSVSGDDQLGSNSIMSLPEFQEIVDEVLLLNRVLNIGDWIPWPDFLDLQGYVKRMKALKKKLDRFHDHVFDQHKRKKKELAKNFVPQDMVDLLLQLADDPDLDFKLTYDHLRGLTLDLIAGGTDTAAVEEKDIPHLPYLDAIMKETMRKHPVTSLLPPHLAMENCEVAEYDIQKGTRVFVNLWSIGRDPSLWEQPEEFRPERFLGRNIDVKGRSFELLPFGAGRRMCPGYNLGLKMDQLSIANLLQAFNWKLPDNTKVEDLSMEEASGLTTPRKFPLVAVMEPRLPLHLYKI
ncbi:Kinase superfamily protein [Hibiscus syriacus]|uniref:Kinase superfamily protein n=1 Tax=Hibiscus syriacus TaxID=106335 RepID=A0A6A2XNL1_HIBSY|nr:Kinase superfamily protein [Hibiscus syriacus]